MPSDGGLSLSLSLSRLEQKRNLNIERNEAFLKALGLDDIRCAPPVKKQKRHRESERQQDDDDPKKQRRSKAKRPQQQKRNVAEPTRRSSRAKGIPAEGEDKGTSAAPRRAPRQYGSDLELDIRIDDDDTVRRKRVSAQALREDIDQTSTIDEADESVSNEAIHHCLMRIGSMSNSRLATRIKVIARAQGQHCREKLLVFYHALRLSGLEELASSCKAALDLVR
jgi:phage protein D